MTMGQPEHRMASTPAGFHLPVPTNQVLYNNLAGSSLDWDMIEADLCARLDWSGLVEVSSAGEVGRGYYSRSKFETATVSGGKTIRVCDKLALRTMMLRMDARVSVFALSQDLVRVSMASARWDLLREGRAIEVFNPWLAELESGRGTGVLEVSVISGRRGIVAFHSGRRVLNTFQALTSSSFDEAALEWLNALAGRPDAKVRLYAEANPVPQAGPSGFATVELPPISVRLLEPSPEPKRLPVPEEQPPILVSEGVGTSIGFDVGDLDGFDANGVEVDETIPQVANFNAMAVSVKALFAPPPAGMDPIAGSSKPVLGPVLKPVSGSTRPSLEAAALPTPVAVDAAPTNPVLASPVLTSSVSAPASPNPGTILPPENWPMLVAAWSELLAFTERRTDSARGNETFDRIWRESCLVLVERYPELDPFFADVQYARGSLRVRAYTPTLIEALVNTYLGVLKQLGIAPAALKPLIQPIQAKHRQVWSSAGLEDIWPQ